MHGYARFRREAGPTRSATFSKSRCLVLSGKGQTQVWQGDQKQHDHLRVGKRRHIPLRLSTTWHRYINTGKDRCAAWRPITNAPLLIDIVRHTDSHFRQRLRIHGAFRRPQGLLHLQAGGFPSHGPARQRAPVYVQGHHSHLIVTTFQMRGRRRCIPRPGSRGL